MRTHLTYRALTLLYPREFRDRYRDDLIQHHDDLTSSRGRRAAWARSGLDLIVTIPRFSLETIMNQRQATNTLNVLVAALAVAGLMAIVAVDSYVGAALLSVAAIIAFTQWSQLARAIRVRDTGRRIHRLKMAAFFALVTVADTAIAFADIGNDESWGTRAVVYGAISYAAAGAAVCYLFAGLLTRRTQVGQVPEPVAS